MTQIPGIMLLAPSAVEKSVDGDGTIIRGTFTTTEGGTGTYRIGNTVYNEKGQIVGTWNGVA